MFQVNKLSEIIITKTVTQPKIFSGIIKVLISILAIKSKFKTLKNLRQKRYIM